MGPWANGTLAANTQANSTTAANSSKQHYHSTTTAANSNDHSASRSAHTAANSTATAANSTTNDRCHKQQYHSASRSAQPPFLQYNLTQFYLASTIAHFPKQHSKLSRSAHHCHQFHTSRTHMVPGNGLYAASLSFLSFFGEMQQ